jgi:hypothetical protein
VNLILHRSTLGEADFSKKIKIKYRHIDFDWKTNFKITLENTFSAVFLFKNEV